MNFKLARNSFIFQTLQQFYRDMFSHKAKGENKIFGSFFFNKKFRRVGDKHWKSLKKI
jgi:hypothetical protein